MSEHADQVWRRGLTNAETMPTSTLYSRLAEAMSWCDRERSDTSVASSLRSEVFRPRMQHEGRDDVICYIGRSRHFQLGAKCPPIIEHLPDLNGGRLLCYFPDDDLCDGASEQASDGFFDVFNSPPWDTWLAYFDNAGAQGHYRSSYLLSFVPAQLVPLADEGISVNPEECIQWLTDTDVSLRTRFT